LKKKLLEFSNLHPEINKIKNTMLSEITLRWKEIKIEIFVANFFDIRCKLQDCDENTKGVVYQYIWQKMQDFQNKSKLPDNQFQTINSEFWKYINERNLPQTVEKELGLYLSIPVQTTEDPLKWWKINQNTFPTLSKYALEILCIPATEVPCEQLFSTCGEIFNNK